MSLLQSAQIGCPYCGERIELVIDCSAGDQDYIEDCQVCCQPINIHVTVREGSRPRVEVRRDDE
jgi:hypothetical protein